MNHPHGSPEWVIEFARAVCPDSPDLLLSTNEKNILTAATQKILDLESELTQLRTERERLLEYLGRIRPLAKSIALISEADQDVKDMADSIWTISIAALTKREGGEDDHR